MLDLSMKEQLKGYLERLTRPVEIVASLDDSPASHDMNELLDEIVLLSPLLTLVQRRESDEHTPSFALNSPGQDIHVRFAGLPMGHEFTSLILALLQVGGHPSKQTAQVVEQIQSLKGPLVFETYFSQSCQNCPDVVQALNLMAVLNPNVQHVAIDGGAFPQEVEQRQILSVPTVYLNGAVFGQGRMDLGQILSRLDSGLEEKTAKELSEKPAFDVLVVGGGPAGAAAAVYAARKGIRTGVVAERFGGQVLDTLAIENFVSVLETEGPQMAAALEAHMRHYQVDLMPSQKAVGLVPRNDQGWVELRLESGASLKSKTVVLSPGARWRQMNVPGEDHYRNRGVAYCPHCDGPLFKGKRVAVVGGGNSGVEAAIDLAGLVEHVTLFEFERGLRADEVLQKKLASLSNVTVVLSAQVTEVEGGGQRVTGLRYMDRTNDALHSVALEGVFVQIGLLPNTEWLSGVLALTERGEIVVDDRGQTSLPGVFAAGDATTVPYKQIIIAMGDGAKAALSAFDSLIRQPA